MLFVELPLTLFEKDGVRYTEDTRRFALTLYMYSAKAYEFLRKTLPLPCPRTLRNWLAQYDGRPGVFCESIAFLKEKCKENPFLYSECVLMFDVDGMSMNDNLEWDPSAKVMTGYVDLGNGPDESAGRLREAVVFMATSLLGNWKIPVGYLLVNSKSSTVVIAVHFILAVTRELIVCHIMGLTHVIVLT